MADLKQYAAKGVAEHNQAKDSWIIIHGKVYDVTDYIQDHPGGAEAIIEVAGTDSTAAFEDVGHSDDAHEILSKFLIGAVDTPEYVRPKTVTVVKRSVPQATTKSSTSSVGIYATSLFAIGAVGYLFYNINLRRIVNNDHAFAQGFTLASLVSGALGYYVISKVQAAASITAGFTRYPPHLPSKMQPVNKKREINERLPLVEKTRLSKTALRLVFALPTQSSSLHLPVGQHVSIRAEIDGKAVSRSYTPTANRTGRLELVIRVYDNGLLTGKYLSNLSIGDLVEFRGPKGAMKYRKGHASKILMIAGGTGITPMYQVIRAIREDETDKTEVSLIYANRTEDEILLRQELDQLLDVYYVLDQPPEKWQGKKGHVTKDMISPRLFADTKVFICGPPAMVTACKKTLVGLGKPSDDVFSF